MNQLKGFLPILLVVISLVAGYFFTYPQWNDRATNLTAQEAVKKENASLKESEAQLQNFLKQYESTEESRIEQASKVLPLKQADMPNILKSLDGFAAASGVGLSTMAVGDNVSKAGENAVGFLDLNMKVSGSYPSLKTFFLQMENHLRIMDIHSLTINVDEGDMQAQFTVRVYYQK